MSSIWSHKQWNTLISVPTTDQLILAQGSVSLFSTFSIFVILLWSIISFRHDHTLTATKPMRTTCILSMTCFFIESLSQLSGMNNAFVNISTISCRVFYPLQLIAYNFAKIAMFWLFSFRLQLLCDSNRKLRISPIILTLYRISCLILPTVLWIAWLYLTYPDTKPHDTATLDNKYKDCFPETFPDVVLAENIVGFGVVFVDVLFSTSALIAFIIKCYQITALIIKERKHHIPNQDHKSLFSPIKVYQKLHHSPSTSSKTSTFSGYNNKPCATGLIKKLENMEVIIKKSTFLTTIAMLSSMFYTVGASYILRQIGFFLCFDGVINSLCMACLFKFGDDLYGFLFFKCEKMLFGLFYVISCCCCVCCKYCDNHDAYGHVREYYEVSDNKMCQYVYKPPVIVNGNDGILCEVETNESNLNIRIDASLSVNDTDSMIQSNANSLCQIYHLKHSFTPDAHE